MNGNNSFLTWEEAVAWLRTQPDHAQLVFDCYYDDPLIEAAERYWRSCEWTAVQNWLTMPKGVQAKALDVGAGRGIASYALAKEGLNVTALEPDDSALVGSGAIRSLAQETGLPIHVVENFSEHLPFDDGEFHIVFVRAALHHSLDLVAACKEFFRVLRPGGRLIIIREHVISKQDDISDFLEHHPLHKFYGGENAYLLSQYISAIEQSGFAKIKTILPWQSPVNYAPFSLERFKQNISTRIGLERPGIIQMLNVFLGLPGVWKLIRQLLNQIDHRPGRLYSFIAEKR